MHCTQMFLFDIIKCQIIEWKMNGRQTQLLSSKKFLISNRSNPKQTYTRLHSVLAFQRDATNQWYAIAVASNYHRVYAWRVRSKSWSKSGDNERISAENSCSAPLLSHLHGNLPSPRTFPPFKLSPVSQSQAPGSHWLGGRALHPAPRVPRPEPNSNYLWIEWAETLKHADILDPDRENGQTSESWNFLNTQNWINEQGIHVYKEPDCVLHSLYLLSILSVGCVRWKCEWSSYLLAINRPPCLVGDNMTWSSLFVTLERLGLWICSERIDIQNE